VETGNESHRFLHSSATAKKRIKAREQARKSGSKAMHQTPPTDACGIWDRALRASPSAPSESNPKNSKGDQTTTQGIHLSTVDHRCVDFHPGSRFKRHGGSRRTTMFHGTAPTPEGGTAGD